MLQFEFVQSGKKEQIKIFSAVEKVCDGKKMAIKLINKWVKVTNEKIYSFPFSTEINCLFILQSKDGQELTHIYIFTHVFFSEVFNVSTSIIKKGKDQKCNYIRTNNDFIERLEYQCSDGDNCDVRE